MTNTSIIAALNVTVDPDLDKIIMDLADLENSYQSYEKAVAIAFSICTYQQAMQLCDAYKKLAQTMQDAASTINAALHT